MVLKCCPCGSQEMPGGFQVVLFWDKLHTFLAEYNFAKISPEECFVGCPHCANSHFTNNNWNKIQFIPLGTLSEDVFSLGTMSYFFLSYLDFHQNLPDF